MPIRRDTTHKRPAHDSAGPCVMTAATDADRTMRINAAIESARRQLSALSQSVLNTRIELQRLERLPVRLSDYSPFLELACQNRKADLQKELQAAIENRAALSALLELETGCVVIHVDVALGPFTEAGAL